MPILIKEINYEAQTFISEDGTEYVIPDGCLELTKEEIQEQLNIADEFIQNFITTNDYGKVINS